MLTHIHIWNFAIVEQLDIELEQGLTVLTGETGAGKSILLGALGLALGNRIDGNVVRKGAALFLHSIEVNNRSGVMRMFG